MIQHSASGNETKSGEVSDSACSMPAAAVLDAFAHMLVARTLSRAASLNPRASVLPHTQQMSAAMIQHSASGDDGLASQCYGLVLWTRVMDSPLVLWFPAADMA